MEIRTLGYLKSLTTFPTMSCLSAFQFYVRSFQLYQEKHLWSNTQKYSKSFKFNLFKYNDEHTHLDKRAGKTDILDMAFISPSLTKLDIPFLIGDDLGSDHLPIEISIDAQPHRNIHTNPIRYKYGQTDREVFESTLEVALSSGDVPELKSTQGIDKYTDFVTAISTAVGKTIPKSKSGRPESQPVSEESFVLIKEKRSLRWQYPHAHDPLVKTHINQLQKEIKDNLRIESQAS